MSNVKSPIKHSGRRRDAAAFPTVFVYCHTHLFLGFLLSFSFVVCLCLFTYLYTYRYISAGLPFSFFFFTGRAYKAGKVFRWLASYGFSFKILFFFPEGN